MELCYRLISLSISLVLSCPFKLWTAGTAHQRERIFSWNYQIANFWHGFGDLISVSGFNNRYSTAPIQAPTWSYSGVK